MFRPGLEDSFKTLLDPIESPRNKEIKCSVHWPETEPKQEKKVNMR